MNRMFVETKDVDQSEEHQESCSTSTIPITKSYGMALNQFLKTGEQPPRTLDDGSDRFFQKYRTHGEREEANNDSMDVE